MGGWKLVGIMKPDMADVEGGVLWLSFAHCFSSTAIWGLARVHLPEEELPTMLAWFLKVQKSSNVLSLGFKVQGNQPCIICTMGSVHEDNKTAQSELCHWLQLCWFLPCLSFLEAWKTIGPQLRQFRAAYYQHSHHMFQVPADQNKYIPHNMVCLEETSKFWLKSWIFFLKQAAIQKP